MSDRETRFRALVAEVGEPLRRYAVRRVGAESAQDVVSETLMVLWRRLDDVPQQEPLPWCYGVARNCLANVRRSRRRQERLVTRLSSWRDVREVRDTAPDFPDGEEALVAALATLRAADQELLRLWAWEDLGPTEIAVVLGLTPNAVSIRLHRARRALRERLEQEAERSAVLPDRNGMTEGGGHGRA